MLNSNTLCKRINCEHCNKVELHNVLFMQATHKITINLHDVPKVYTGFSNAIIDDVSQYDFANVDGVKQFLVVMLTSPCTEILYNSTFPMSVSLVHQESIILRGCPSLFADCPVHHRRCRYRSHSTALRWTVAPTTSIRQGACVFQRVWRASLHPGDAL